MKVPHLGWGQEETVGASRNMSQGYWIPRSRETWGRTLFPPLSLPSYTPVSLPLQQMQPLVSQQTLCDRNTHNSDSHSCNINREPLGRH